MKLTRQSGVAILVVTFISSVAYADEVVDWNQTMFRAAQVAATSPLTMTRTAAIVQSAVFEARPPGPCGHRPWLSAESSPSRQARSKPVTW